MNAPKAFFAGVVAGAVMSILMAAGRMLAIPLDLEMTLGTLFGLAPGLASTWMVGFVTHLVIAGVFGVIYAVCFENLMERADWSIGAAFGFVHVIIAGMLAGLMPFIHPLMPDPMPEPGLFATNLGAGAALLFIVQHLVFGALVGGLYAMETTGEQAREAHA